jgi:hypothetical protein
MGELEERATSDLAAEATIASHLDVAPALRSDALAAEEQIRMRAFELYRERGGTAGDDMSDWLRAEREYLERRLHNSAASPAEQRAPTLS